MKPEQDRIWLSPPHMGGSELAYITQAFESNWISPLGPQLDAFEAALSEYLDVPYVLAVASGTAALHLALRVLGVGPGDEVLVSSFTFIATANPVLYCGAEPIFVDSEPRTWNASPQALDEAINDGIRRGRKPKAAVLADLYGMPCSYEEIISILARYQIPLIEDAAEALGSVYREKKLGSLGKAGVLSFNGNKIITTSGGGALVSDDRALVDEARFLATQARDPAPHYQHSTYGYNYRLSNVLAAIGRGQLEVLDPHIERRRANFSFYKSRLSELPGVSFLPEPPHCRSNRWLTTMLIDPVESGGVRREDVYQRLAEVNIESRPLWKPLHLQPVFENYRYFGGRCSEELFEKGICLPSGSALTPEELERIVGAVRDCFH